MKNSCVEVVVYGEKNYRVFLDVVKQELDIMAVNDINAIQAFILMNINDSVVTVGEIISRGYYIGSNASYNVRRLSVCDYVQQSQSEYDRRAVYLRLTQKGLALCERLDDAINTYWKKYSDSKLKDKIDLNAGANFLKNVEHFWTDILLRRI